MQTQTYNVLTILKENLQQSHPQLVPSSTIANQLQVELPALKQALKRLEGIGVIETDPDQEFNLITPKGLLWLGEYNPLLQGEKQAFATPWGATEEELADRLYNTTPI